MTQKLILLINSEDDIREILSICFRHFCKWNVVAFARLEDGLRNLEKLSPDAIVLDVDLRNTHNIALIQQLKQNSQTQSIPILLIADKADELTLHDLEEMGALAAIGKLFNPSYLPVQVAGLLGWSLCNMTCDQDRSSGTV